MTNLYRFTFDRHGELISTMDLGVTSDSEGQLVSDLIRKDDCSVLKGLWHEWLPEGQHDITLAIEPAFHSLAGLHNGATFILYAVPTHSI